MLPHKEGNSSAIPQRTEHGHVVSYFGVFIWLELHSQGLTEKFEEKDMSCSGFATFGYEAFLLTILDLFPNRMIEMPGFISELNNIGK
jgi:hypothetical protein